MLEELGVDEGSEEKQEGRKEAIWLLKLKGQKIQVNEEALDILRWIDEAACMNESADGLKSSGVGVFTVIGPKEAKTRVLMNKLINEDNGFEEPKSDKSKIKKVDNSEKGLRMWADPILSAQRGVFGVPMTLEGFHLKKDNNEAND